MEDMIKIVKSIEESGLLTKGTSEAIKDKRRIYSNVIRNISC